MSGVRTAPILGFAAALLIAGQAFAAPPPPSANAAAINTGLQALKNYNLIVQGSVTSSSEVDGRTFIGGDLNGSSSNYYNHPGSAPHPGLKVVGNVNGGAKSLNNGAGADVGGNVNSGFNLNGSNQTLRAGGTISNTSVNTNTVTAGVAGLATSLANERDTMFVGLNDLSAYLKGLTATNALTYDSGANAVFNAGTGTGIAVFQVNDLFSALNGHNQILFTLPTTYDAVVVNVAGTSVSLPNNINFNGPTNLGQKVIWNFYDATLLNFGAQAWYGSVLAPKAAATTGNFIEGTAVFASLTQNGEVHMNNYNGGLQVNPPTSAAPEPTAWALMLMGFGGLGAILRRRRAFA